MIRDLINSIEKIEIPSADRRFGITRVLKRYDGTPVYIKDVDGYQVIGNLCNRDIIAKSLGVPVKDLMKHILRSMEREKEGELIINNTLKREYIEDPPSEINNYPIPIYYPRDGGPYITSGVVIVKDRDYGVNASIHRILVKGDRLVIRMVEQRHLHYIYSKNIEEDGEIDVAIVIGVHPAILLAASTSGDITFNELKYASVLMGKPLELIKCDTVDLEVPPGEFIIEGKITREMEDEGPFVDITGTYDKVRKQPVIRITSLKRRKDPIFHALLPGGVEHKVLMGLPQEPRIYRGVRNVVPSVKDVVLTEGGCCWLHAVISIEKRTEGDGKNAILAALASHPSLKHVVVVDQDINIGDPKDVEYAIATRVQADRDVVIIKGAKGSSLDPSINEDKTTAKMGIDATISLKKNREDFIRAELPEDK
ncbi:MAG TPA: UbiD family decarboxylase [Methanothermococcus okinawensis]|uniref:Anhydromevalonate phosphate decarboxylase n=1 Tax=Methanothermococcus okinawensis TaxID=155863 RepID=A0A832ZI94_9EURY|nr:UbiD family decarboxylase [Methanococcaceae archaeon]HIP84119.1 UbiD family decarboxylase [Methanothermococcus okinawensis]HIP91665.1 UbiD family decarboxylase [Methanothermococcus okinawensis]